MKFAPHQKPFCLPVNCERQQTSFEIAHKAIKRLDSSFYWICGAWRSIVFDFSLLFPSIDCDYHNWLFHLSAKKIPKSPLKRRHFSVCLPSPLSRRLSKRDALGIWPNNYGYGIQLMIKLITRYLRHGARQKIPSKRCWWFLKGG